MELFAADGHDAGGCERVTGKSGMRPSGMVSSSVPVLGTHRRPHVLCQARPDANTRRARSNRVPLTLACHNATLVMTDCMTSWSYNPFFSHRRGDTPCHCRPVAAAPSTEKRSALSVIIIATFCPPKFVWRSASEVDVRCGGGEQHGDAAMTLNPRSHRSAATSTLAAEHVFNLSVGLRASRLPRTRGIRRVGPALRLPVPPEPPPSRGSWLHVSMG